MSTSRSQWTTVVHRWLVGCALGAGIALAASGAAGEEPPQSCNRLTISINAGNAKEDVVSPCATRPKTHGVVKGAPAGTKVYVDGKAADIACANLEGAAAGDLCFDAGAPGDDHTITAIDGNAKVIKFVGKNNSLEDKYSLAHAPAPQPNNLEQPQSPAAGAGTDDCDKKGSRKKQVWCHAYEDAIAHLWAGVGGAPPELAFDAWWKLGAHVEHRNHGRYALFFTSDGQPIAPLPQVDENDTVVIVVVSKDETKALEELKVTTCNPADPLRIGGTAVVPSLVKPLKETVEAPAPDVHQLRMVKGCSSDKGINAVARVKGETESKPLYVPTLAIYHLTVGLGFIYDATRVVDFRASSIKGENVPVIVRDEHVQGLTPGIVFVNWRPFGVDTQRTRWSPSYVPEWLALSLGFNLAAPLDHLYLGVLIEPYPGLGLIGGAHFHTVNSLGGGYQVGDRFPAGAVPIDKRWDITATNGFFGFHLDATVLGKLLKVFQ